MSVKDMTNEELIKEWKELNEIVDLECYNIQQVVRFHLLTRELENRGYKIKITRTLIKES